MKPVSEFASTIAKIQDAKPEVLMSHLVGANHIAIFRQFAVAGLKDSIKIVSPTFGLGFEEQELTPEEGSGIVVAYAYIDSLDTAINKQFNQDFFAAYPDWKVLTDLSVQTWNAWHQWALGVEKAGTLDQAAVIEALETGIEFEGPGGVVKIDPATHHTSRTSPSPSRTSSSATPSSRRFRPFHPPPPRRASRRSAI